MSLRYLLTRNPKNVDDCIDYARDAVVSEATLSLDTEETSNEVVIVRHLIAQFDFIFSDRVVSFRSVLGGCLAHESKKKQSSNIDKANGKLIGYQEKFQKLGVEIKGLEKRFDYSMISHLEVIKFTPEDAFIPY